MQKITCLVKHGLTNYAVQGKSYLILVYQRFYDVYKIYAHSHFFSYVTLFIKLRD